MPKLTVIIPTLNEEAYLEDALQSVDFADEIIVIDSLSTDETAAIATRMGARVIQRPFDNFSNQRNHAIEAATGEWILFVDADERVPYALKKEILQVLDAPQHSAYKITFPHFYMNRFLYHHSDRVLRLVKREGIQYAGKVHEKLQVEGSVGTLKEPMLHYTYRGLEAYIRKKESYAWFQATQLHEKGKKASWYHFWVKPGYRFFRSYFLKGGFRDGIPGLIVATVNAYGVFQRYVKLRLLQKGMR